MLNIDLGSVVAASRAIWEFIRSRRLDSLETSDRRAFIQLRGCATSLRRYARVIEEYAAATEDPAVDFSGELALLLDVISERLEVFEYFSNEVLHITIQYRSKIGDELVEMAWFQSPAYERWSLLDAGSARELGNKRLLRRVASESARLARAIGRDYGEGEEEEWDLEPEIGQLTTDVVALRSVAGQARVLAKSIDEVIEETWSLREALGRNT
jgi:hypothetical protein